MGTTPRQRPLPTWGGRREGAGRKPAPRRRVSHRARPEHTARFPLHVVLRTLRGIPSLRRRRIFDAVRAAVEAGCSRFGMRIVHFSVQGNHIHLIVEAADKLSLTRGMHGLMVRIARALQTPTVVRRAVRYVLDNAMLHAGGGPRTDPCASSGPIVRPRTWLLSVGWLRSRGGPLPVSAWSSFEDDGAWTATSEPWLITTK